MPNEALRSSVQPESLSMPRFLTTNCKGLQKPVLLWEEQADGLPRIVGRFASIEEVPDAADYDIWAFPDENSAVPNCKVNQSGQAIVDADGAPLWEGAKISFRVQTHYVNTASGTGIFVSANQYGGTQYVSDREMNVYDRGGFIVARRREQYTALSTFVYDRKSEFAGCRVLTSKIGDPYEHGQETLFIRLAEDPRGVCKLEKSPASTPSP